MVGVFCAIFYTVYLRSAALYSNQVSWQENFYSMPRYPSVGAFRVRSRFSGLLLLTDSYEVPFSLWAFRMCYLSFNLEGMRDADVLSMRFLYFLRLASSR